MADRFAFIISAITRWWNKTHWDSVQCNHNRAFWEFFSFFGEIRIKLFVQNEIWDMFSNPLRKGNLQQFYYNILTTIQQ